MDLTKAIAELAYNIPAFVIIFLLLYHIFQKAIESKIEVMKTNEIEPLKNELNKGLELYKKELELNNARTKIIYDNQKNSFKEISVAMDNILQKLAWSYNTEEDSYFPLSENDYKDLRDKLIGDSLFVSSKAWRSVEIFLKVLGEVVAWDVADNSN